MSIIYNPNDVSITQMNSNSSSFVEQVLVSSPNSLILFNSTSQLVAIPTQSFSSISSSWAISASYVITSSYSVSASFASRSLVATSASWSSSSLSSSWSTNLKDSASIGPNIQSPDANYVFNALQGFGVTPNSHSGVLDGGIVMFGSGEGSDHSSVFDFNNVIGDACNDSFVCGEGNTIRGQTGWSALFGYGNIIDGNGIYYGAPFNFNNNQSLAGGYFNIISGSVKTFIFGESNVNINAHNSIILGYKNRNIGPFNLGLDVPNTGSDYSIILGDYNFNAYSQSFIIGSYNTSSKNSIFLGYYSRGITIDALGTVSASIFGTASFASRSLVATSASWASASISSSYSSGSVLGVGIFVIEYITSASYALLNPPLSTTLYIISSST